MYIYAHIYLDIYMAFLYCSTLVIIFMSILLSATKPNLLIANIYNYQ